MKPIDPEPLPDPTNVSQDDPQTDPADVEEAAFEARLQQLQAEPWRPKPGLLAQSIAWLLLGFIALLIALTIWGLVLQFLR